MKITFLGAAQNVTGSRFLLETDKTVLLIDCGLYQERDLAARNWEAFPFEPAKIDALLLTHAHLDHVGYLPKLIREGYRGRIYCTAPTAQMTKISLLDSAHVQEADAAFKRRRHQKEGRTGPYPEAPLYTVEDAQKVFSHLHPIPFAKSMSCGKDVTATFYEAGHILGAAMLELEVREKPISKRIVFSGDIGRWGRPLLKDPHLFPKADYVVMEATYGDRFHDEDTDCVDKLAEVINQTHQRGGNIVIPSFAIGRTQELLYDLNLLLRAEKIPAVLTFVDSPMAMEVTEIFKNYSGYFDQEAQDILRQNLELFSFPLLKFTPTANESKAINNLKGTAIIMAGSGMCTGGRIKHHLAHNISRPESTILFVGYQAAGSLGRLILEKPEDVRIFGSRIKVRAGIEKINGFSAHADQRELLKWVAGFKTPPKKVFIVHAEKKAAEALGAKIQERFKAEVGIPAYQNAFFL